MKLMKSGVVRRNEIIKKAESVCVKKSGRGLLMKSVHPRAVVSKKMISSSVLQAVPIQINAQCVECYIVS